jgi:diguanylate cyclase (GGDEF)-like protein
MEEGSPRDTVTGLYNKAYLDAALEQVIALRRRTAPEQRPPLSMIMFDIDSFALINERYGRHVGDHVLRSVATLLRQRFRASDIVARIGPDSFMVAMNGADPDVAADAAAHIRRQVRELNLASSTGEPIIVSLSAGCAAYHDGERTDALYRSVEAALDTARWSGPGAVVAI